VIAAITAVRPLAGCSTDVIRRVRDPAAVAAVVRDARLRFPDTYRSPTGLPTDDSFLVKPVRSAGGRGVHRWSGATLGRAGRDLIWQRFVRGDCRSASYVARHGAARLVGSSRPLTGASWCGGREFSYCGSVNLPLDDLPDGLRQTFERLGSAVAAAFGLTGLFGIDLVVDAAGEVHVLEVNPRPTASMELVERSTGWSVAAAHLAAYGWCAEPRGGAAAGDVWAKAIVYASTTVRSASSVAEIIAALADRWTAADGLAAVADIPRADEQPMPGAPLVTVFARGDTHDRAVATLRRRVLRLRRSIASGLIRGALDPRAS
jgi:predicted ATP-grasp superfamily ATP-dependent carboligase